MIGSKIEWTGATFNPWIGCTKVSAGCTHCYAEVQTFPRTQRAAGRELWGPRAQRHRTSPSYWLQPERWNAEAERTGARLKVFCASLCDVFEPRDDIAPHRADLWPLIERTPHLDWQLLTKRPQHVKFMVPGRWLTDWPAHAWIGTSIEDAMTASARLAWLRAVPAPVRFVSAEPLIADPGALNLDGIAWVIIGGESGAHARPFDIVWARSLIEQCRRAGAAPFVKQLGAAPLRSFPDGRQEPLTLQDRKGGDWAEWPPGLRVREFPEVRA